MMRSFVANESAFGPGKAQPVAMNRLSPISSGLTADRINVSTKSLVAVLSLEIFESDKPLPYSHLRLTGGLAVSIFRRENLRADMTYDGRAGN